MIFRISDIKKYMRCHRLFQMELNAEKTPYQPLLKLSL